jgi:hypothetical protein
MVSYEGAQHVALLWKRGKFIFFPAHQAVLVESQKTIPVEALWVPRG